MIQKLKGNRGDVRAILGLPTESGLQVDLSGEPWWSVPDVLSGLDFKGIRLAGTFVRIDLVECTFSDCVFEEIRSEGHFWAAENSWQRCRFVAMDLHDVVSPGDTFEDCEFVRGRLVGYRPSKTIYERCTFDRMRFEGLKTVRGRKGMGTRAGKMTAGELAFNACKFRSPVFANSSFNEVLFDGCEVDAPVLTGVQLEGAIGQAWWGNARSSDPFQLFLAEVIAFAERRFGTASASYRALQGYADRFASGATKSRDYSAALYAGGVPNDELDELEDALDRLEKRFPF